MLPTMASPPEERGGWHLEQVVERLAALEGRVAELERILREALPEESPDQPAPVPPQSARIDHSATSPKPPDKSAAPDGLDLETVIGGQLLNRIGIVALLLATAFFLKYAFDNNWIGPHGRVALGLLVGAGLLVYSQWLLLRGYSYFADGIAGLGAGVLYLSLFAAWNFYQLIAQEAAFVGMTLVAAGLIALALGRDSERIALLALLGGMLTPLLLSTGRDTQLVLFTYLAVLNAGLLAVALTRDWRMLEPLALAGTVLYFIGWYSQFYLHPEEQLLRTVLFATLFFSEFTALPIIRSRQNGLLQREQVFFVLLNAAWFLAALHKMLYAEYRWTLTLTVLALAAVYLWVVRLLPKVDGEQASVARLVFAGLALTFVTIAIPIRLEGKWFTIGWCLEGAVLVWMGFRTRMRYLRTAGLVLFAVVAWRLLVFSIPAERFLLNARFATFAVAIGCFAVGYLLSQQHKDTLQPNERQAFAVLGIVVNPFTVFILSHEVWDAIGRMEVGAGFDRALAQHLALSLLWIVYATVLIVLGVRQNLLALRWQALVLFGLVVGKVFLHDLSFLNRFYRIISFLVLGVMLLVVSFLYQRKLATERSGPPS